MCVLISMGLLADLENRSLKVLPNHYNAVVMKRGCLFNCLCVKNNKMLMSNLNVGFPTYIEVVIIFVLSRYSKKRKN